ncbi:MAG: RNA pseudouridine synthase, partial [Oscillospiraceae bacterium]|nr:RNA pseudouridine synthase [Oscillospiraceae bacterium]
MEDQILIAADRPGERADVLLARQVEGLSRSAAARLLEQGAVLRRGVPLGKSALTAPGDVLEVTLP